MQKRSEPETRNMRHLNRGFTLIELLIAVAIIGILGSVAYPAYNGYVTQARRTAAQEFLMDVANAEETYRVDALTYVANIGAGGLNLTPADKLAPYYTFTVTNVTPTTYTLSATPQGGQTGPVLTLDQSGAKNW